MQKPDGNMSILAYVIYGIIFCAVVGAAFVLGKFWRWSRDAVRYYQAQSFVGPMIPHDLLEARKSLRVVQGELDDLLRKQAGELSGVTSNLEAVKHKIAAIENKYNKPVMA